MFCDSLGWFVQVRPIESRSDHNRLEESAGDTEEKLAKAVYHHGPVVVTNLCGKDPLRKRPTGKDPLRKRPTGKDPFSSGKDPLGGKKPLTSLGF